MSSIYTMRKLRLILSIFCVVIAADLSSSAVLSGSSVLQPVYNYDLRIQVLHTILTLECPHYSYYGKPLGRRQQDVSDLEADRLVYRKLYKDL